MKTCPKCNETITDHAVVCPICNSYIFNEAPSKDDTFENYNTTSLPTNNLPMKWYNALVKFFLFYSAVSNISGGVLAYTGALGEILGYNYNFGDPLQRLDTIYGLCCIAFGIYTIYVQIQLKNFKKNAPNLLYYMYYIGLLIGVAYQILAFTIATFCGNHYNFQLWSLIVSCIINLIILGCNKTYFNNREDLFVN